MCHGVVDNIGAFDASWDGLERVDITDTARGVHLEADAAVGFPAGDVLRT